MLEHARRNPDKAFSTPIPGNRLHLMCSKQHWDDLNSAQTSQLSPNAASREMFQPKHTFGYDWVSPRESISLATVRSLRNTTQQLPSLQGSFVRILDEEFDKVLPRNPEMEVWTRVKIWPVIQRAVTRMSTLVLFGEDVANDEEFTTRALKFMEQTGLIIEGVRLVPAFLAPFITMLIRGRGRDREHIFRVIRRLVAEREIYNDSTPEQSRKSPTTFLEGVVNYCQDNRSTQQNIFSILTTWATSTLATLIVTCHLIQDLYTQPEYLSKLQTESTSVPLNDTERSQEFFDTVKQLPFLETFMMESWRKNCFQANTVHRIAVKPFQFSDGYKVQAGEAVEFHQRGLIVNEATYPQSEKFDPNRFLDKGKSAVDTSIQWPFWSVARHICPGRFQVTNIEKLVAVYFLQNFDATLESIKNLNFAWRDTFVPNPNTILTRKA